MKRFGHDGRQRSRVPGTSRFLGDSIRVVGPDLARVRHLVCGCACEVETDDGRDILAMALSRTIATHVPYELRVARD